MGDEAKRQITPLLPQGISLERVVSTLYQVVADNEELLECTPASLIMAVGRGVKWDLDFGETVHLVPFNVNLAKKGQTPRWEKRAKAIRDYKGDIELVIRSGAARHVEAQCFYANEPFKYEQGTAPFIEHHPIVDVAKRGPMVGAYAWARINTQSLKISVMAVPEIDKIRQEKSKSWKDGPLPDWYARKTLVHQVTKAIPKNAKLAEVLRQFDVEEEEIPEGEFEVVKETPVAAAPAAPAAAAPETAAPAAEPVDDTPALEEEEADWAIMTLEQAKATKLLGVPGSWKGKVGTLLDSFSSKHLETIQSWLVEKIKEGGDDPDKQTMSDAISLILADRNKNQTTLEFDSAKTAGKVEAMQGTKPAAQKKGDSSGLPF
jgi:phage RecT family recombinase